MADTDRIAIAGKQRDRALVATLLIGMGIASVGLFGAGLFPAYLWETDGQFPDPGARCPERVATEQGYDVECVRELMRRGPIYLGKELLAASLLVGAAALVGAFRFDRRLVTWSAAALLLFPYFFIGYPLAFWGHPPGLIHAAYLVGLAVILGAAVLAWRRHRPALVALSIVYLAAWIGLLMWNAERALHFLGEGI